MKHVIPVVGYFVVFLAFIVYISQTEFNGEIMKSQIEKVKGKGLDGEGGITFNQNYGSMIKNGQLIIPLNSSFPKKGDFKIEVYNTIGNLLWSEDFKNVNLREYRIYVEYINFPPGVYYFKITGGNITQVKKVVFLK